MTTMGDLHTAKTTVRATMLKGTSGPLAAERVEEQLTDYQRALKAAVAERLRARLAALLRAEGDKLGYNRMLAYRRCAALVEEAEVDL